ncbi:hypothetical protein [Xanthocytophaga agilis]|uniref:Uncharacterized protein n=1 Tax=Xanthocytophaga agilis TaxID=3048010 RepID=A0AAE3UHU6_9BACT|nr:hypothetical protein [Xanthocytophaga agilis]MDJ1503867.1 hypothetical protein [Xanthocytophaga agilis]
MKHLLCCTMLMLSIAGISFAQTTTDDWLTDKPSSIKKTPFVKEDRQLIIPLENENKVIIGLQDNADLLRFRNVDSLLTIFLQDLSQIKDSLSSSTESLKVLYRLKKQERNMRFWRYPMSHTQIDFQTDENLLVKAAQDTIVIEQGFSVIKPLTPGEIRNNAKGEAIQTPASISRHFRIYFLVNSLDDLEKIIQGKLNPKIEKLISDMKNTEKRSVFDSHVWASEVTYTGMQTPASVRINKQLKPDQILIIPRFGMGLVGNTIMPSIGANVIFLPQILYKRGLAHSTTQSDGFLIGWERFFAFGRDGDNQITIHSNDFLSLGIAGFKSSDIQRNNWNNRKIQWAEFKVGYLIRRQGDFFRPNTFRISTAFSPYMSSKGLQRLRLEPELYFNDLFRHVYPGLRLTLGF